MEGRGRSASVGSVGAVEQLPGAPSFAEFVDWDLLIGGGCSRPRGGADGGASGSTGEGPPREVDPPLFLAKRLIGGLEAFLSFPAGDSDFVVRSCTGSPHAIGLKLPLEGSLHEEAWLRREIAYSGRSAQSPSELPELCPGAQGFVCVPLMREGSEVIGVLSVARSTHISRAPALDALLMAVARFAVAELTLRVQTELGSQARSELLLSEALASKIISMASEAVISFDEDQRIGLWNRGAEEVFGYRRDEALGEPLDLIIPPGHRAFHKEHVRAFIEGSIDARHMRDRRTIHGLKKNGDVFPAEASISKVEIGGRVILNVVLRDVTEREEGERELTRFAEELARSNAELEQFAYAASHDLKEPLRMVESYCRLLQRRYVGKLDSDADDFIEFAVGGATRMRGLVDDLLEYARIGSADLDLRPVDLGVVVEEVLRNIQVAVTESGAHVHVAPLPTVLGDARQLSLVFQNLLTNATKFCSDVPPEIDVSAVQVDSDWVVTVADHGLGIPIEFQDQIFSLFKRLHPVDSFPGTGLGLALVRRVMDRHEGRVWVESSPGHGARFHLALPNAGGEPSD